MRDIFEISKPAGPRPAGLSGMLSGARFSGASATATPAQVEPQPLNPPFPGMSQGGFADNAKYRNLWKRPWQVRPPTSAPNQQADAEGGKRKKKVFESLYDLIEKKRAEGGWPGEKPYSGPQKPLDEPKSATPAQTKPTEKPEDDDIFTKIEKGEKKAQEWMNDPEKAKTDIPDTLKSAIPEKWRQQRQRYPTNPPNITQSSRPSWGTVRQRQESTLISAVLQLQEMDGNIFTNAKKKVIEGVGYAKDSTQSVLQGNRPINKSDRGIGPTVSLTYEGGKKKRTEGGDPGTAGIKGLPGGPSGSSISKPYQDAAGPPPTGGKLSQMGTGEPGETKNYGPAPSGGKLSQMGKSSPTPSMTDKDLGGDAGAAAGTAAGASAGSTADQASTAAASGAATGSSGKEGSTSPVSSGTDISATTVVGGPKQPPSGPTPTKTEGGKKSAHSRR